MRSAWLVPLVILAVVSIVVLGIEASGFEIELLDLEESAPYFSPRISEGVLDSTELRLEVAAGPLMTRTAQSVSGIDPLTLINSVRTNRRVTVRTEVEIFDEGGSSIRTLASQTEFVRPLDVVQVRGADYAQLAAAVTWDGRDENGDFAPDGRYRYRLFGDLFTFADEPTSGGPYDIVTPPGDQILAELEPVEGEIVVDNTVPRVSIECVPVGEFVNEDVSCSPGIVETNLGSSSGQLDGEPYEESTPIADEGRHVVDWHVDDLAGNSASESATFVLDKTPPSIFVAEPPYDSEVQSAIPTIRVELADAPSSSGIEASGPNSDSLALTLDGRDRIPETTITSGRATYQVPSSEPLADGVHTIRAELSDRAGNTSAVESRFTVAAASGANRPPTLLPIGGKSVSLGRTLEFRVQGSDPDDDPIQYTVTPLPLPQHASFDRFTGMFRFRPTTEQVGHFPLSFIADDGRGGQAREHMRIEVIGPQPNGITGLRGRLLDTNDAVRGVETPIRGATISLLGRSSSAVSSDDGYFEITSIEASSNYVLDISTTTAQPAPDGAPYAGFREKISLEQRVLNVVERPFYLPRIDRDSLTVVNPSSTTIVENPNLDIQLSVSAGSARDASGQLYDGELSISEVPEGLAPAAMPEELQPGLLVTIQPVGVTFDPPAPISFPNSDALEPGNSLNLWSIDPDLGQFVVVGRAAVDEDDSTVRTVEGGVRAADWHFVLPPAPAFLSRDLHEDPTWHGAGKPRCTKETGSRTDIKSGTLVARHSIPSYLSMGESRTVTLSYSSTAADPRPILSIPTRVEEQAPVPDSISARLSVAGIAATPDIYTTTAALDETRDEDLIQRVQFDASAFQSGTYEVDALVTAHYGSSAVSSLIPAQVTVWNESESSIGTGWVVDGLETLTPSNSGGYSLRQAGGLSTRFERVEDSVPPLRAISDSSLQEPNTRGFTYVATGDVNGDGIDDLVQDSYDSEREMHRIAVHLGSPSGLSPAPVLTRLASTSDPSWGVVPRAIADVNNDGVGDVVSHGPDGIEIYLGTGDGRFEEGSLPTDLPGSDQVIIADFNADGRDDILTSMRDIVVGLGDGDSVLLPGVSTRIQHNRVVGVCRLNEDPFPDLIVEDNTVGSLVYSFLTGRGNGQFELRHTLPADGGRAVAFDVNGDGYDELVIEHSGTAREVWSFSEAELSLVSTEEIGANAASSVLHVIPSEWDLPATLVRLERVGPTPTNKLEFLTGRSDFSLTEYRTHAFGSFPRSLQYPFREIAADFNGDNAPDLIAEGLRVVYGATVDDQFRLPRIAATPSQRQGSCPSWWAACGDMAVTDIDLDGVVDVVATGSVGGDLVVFLGSADGELTRDFTSGDTDFEPTNLATGDIDGDGADDVVAISGSEGRDSRIAIWMATGDGSFGDPEFIRIGWPGHDIELTDLDSNGSLDIVASTANGVLFYSGDGSGRFLPPQQISERFLPPLPVLGWPGRTLLVQDINEDALADIVVNRWRSGTNTVEVSYGLPDFHFSQPEVYSLSDAPLNQVTLACEDVVGDGRCDLLATSVDQTVLIPAIDGEFTEPSLLPIRGAGGGIAAEDLDREGNADLVVGTTDGIAILYGNGESFTEPQFIWPFADAAHLEFVGFGGDHSSLLALIPGGLVSAELLGPEPPRFRSPSAIDGASRITLQSDGLATRVLPDGSSMSYDANGRQVAAVDRNGNRTDYGYTADRLTSIVDPVGNRTAFSYAGDLLESITDPLGRTTKFRHDAFGNLTEVRDPDGSARSFEYDEQQRLVRQVTKTGDEILYSYDSAGRHTRTLLSDDLSTERVLIPADSVGIPDVAAGVGTESNPAPLLRPGEHRVATFSRGGSATERLVVNEWGDIADFASGDVRWSATHDEQGRTVRYQASGSEAPTAYEYDALGNVTSITEGLGTDLERATTFAYVPGTDRVARITDALGHSSIFEYDSRNNLRRAVDAAGSAVELTYDARGLVTSFKDERDHVTSLLHDPLGNVESIESADGARVRFERDNAGNVVREVRAASSVDESERLFDYDDLNRLTGSISALGNRRIHLYDAAGRLKRHTRPAGEATEFSYDPRNRPEEIATAYGGTLGMDYGALGDLVALTDGSGRTTSFEHDSRGNLTRIENPGGSVDRLEYDSSPYARLVRYDDGSGRVREFEYDALGRLTRATDPEPLAYEYDANDNLVRLTRGAANLIEISYEYDELDRLVRIVTPDDDISYGYDARSNLTSASDADSSLAFTYDELDRLVSEELSTPGRSPTTVSYEYDLRGNLAAIRDSLGGVTEYRYDADDQLTEVFAEGQLQSTVSYDENGRIDSINRTNGVSTTYTYGTRELLEGIQHRSGTGASLTAFSYNYDVIGGLESETRDGVTRSFAYDEAGQLLAETALGSEQYQYDALGNRASSHLSGSYEHGSGGTPTLLLSDERFEFAYDDVGRRTDTRERASGLTQTYSYDAFDRLTAVSLLTGGQVGFRYDALGRRIERRGPSETSLYVNARDLNIVTTDESGQLRARYVYGPGQEAPFVIFHGERTFSLTDRLGSIVATVNDAGVVGSASYEVYGRSEDLLSEGFDFAWVGQRYDAELDLYDFGARWYDPEQGRFLTPDPIGLTSGDSNEYRYAFNDPFGAVDADGRIHPCVAIGVAGGLAGGAIDVALQLYENGGDPNCVDIPSVLGNAAIAGAVDGFTCGAGKALLGKAKLAREAARAFRNGLARGRESLANGRLWRGAKEAFERVLRDDSGVLAPGGFTPRGRGAVNVTSGGRTVDEALATGQRFIGEGAQEVGPGVFRSADGTRQFRMTDADIAGSHGKIGPHVHFEKFDPVTGEKIKNIHTPLKDQ